MKQFVFGQLPDGQDVQGFTLENALGMQVRVMEYGATITHFKVPSSSGNLVDIVLGFDSLSGYLGDHPCFGSTIGRYANRIDNGTFMIDGQRYQVTQNEGNHLLHGGALSFDKKMWQGKPLQTPLGQAAQFDLLSPDGEEGFPGNLAVSVTYLLTFNGKLSISYQATTDAPTVVNLTNHAYFNLNGRGHISDTHLQLMCDQFTPGNAKGIPDGTVREVHGPFDFRQLKLLGQDLDHPDLANRKGYDHNFVVNGEAGKLRQAAKAWSEASGVVLETWTTEPCMQLYTGNWLHEIGEKRGGTVEAYHAFCLETQHAPDAPNHPGFVSPVLRPGETFHSQTIYRIDAVG